MCLENPKDPCEISLGFMFFFFILWRNPVYITSNIAYQ